MFLDKTFNCASPLAEMLHRRKFKLVAKKDSPLAALTNQTIKPPVGANQVVSMDHTIQTVQQLNSDPDDKDSIGIDQRGLVLTELVETAAKAVQKDLTIAQSLVIPAVQELVNEVSNRVSSIGTSGLLGLEVKQWAPPKPLETGVLNSILDEFRDTIYASPKLALVLPELMASEIKQLCRVGSTRIDKDIDFFLSSKGDEWLVDIYERAFRRRELQPNEKPYTFEDLIFDKTEGSGWALVIFLIARRLYDNPPDGLQMSLNTWNMYTSQFRNLSGQKLARDVDSFENMKKRQQVVMWINNNVVLVYEPVYREWLNLGGSNELLFGLLLSDINNCVTVDDLSRLQPELVKKWQYNSNLVELNHASRQYNATIQAFNDVFEKMILDIPKEEALSVYNAGAMLTKFRELSAELTHQDTKTPYVAAVKLLCRTRFSVTNAETILMMIHDVNTACPNLTMREAAALATVQYVGDWVLSQVDICKY